MHVCMLMCVGRKSAGGRGDGIQCAPECTKRSCSEHVCMYMCVCRENEWREAKSARCLQGGRLTRSTLPARKDGVELVAMPGPVMIMGTRASNS